MRTLNQPPPLERWNLFEADPALEPGLKRVGAEWITETAREFGEVMGRTDTIAAGFDANRFPPQLHTHDRYGNRIDEVRFHPAWHHLMHISIRYGLHSLPWEEPRTGGHTARAVLFYLASQNEAGHGCPISMTYACTPTLMSQPDVAEPWLPLILDRSYDDANRPASAKGTALIGMAMTERQGGTDVRANETTATPRDGGGPGAEYHIDGQKWFCSAPMCDAFLVLAQAPGGLSCFLVPRWRPDGTRNGLHLDRLKDKLGNRSNASSEARFNQALGWMIGEEGRGVPTIIEMVNHTRLDCVTGSASLMRRAVTEAAHHARYRSVFGKRLVEHDLMRTVLSDLALETEAAAALMFRLAAAFDQAVDPRQAAIRRLLTPTAKFWVTKRCTPVVVEALECLGGNGYVEEFMLPRLLRESPLNSIWEGSGNVMVLDMLRAMAKTPDLAAAIAEEFADLVGTAPQLDAAISRVQRYLTQPPADLEARGRSVAMDIATTFAAAELVRYWPDEIADAYLGSRLDEHAGWVLGSLDPGFIADGLISRITPPV